MRHHKTDHPVNKSKDYLLFEKNPFEFAMGTLFRMVLEMSSASTPADISSFLSRMANHLESHNPVTQVEVDLARDLSWKYLKTEHATITGLTLVFLVELSEGIVAKAKE